MHRLFVALRPPEAMRAQLLAEMGGVRGARWQDDDQLHLTLRFIGEVERPQAEDIATVLGTIDHPAPTIALDGVGTFETRGRPHTVWAGVRHDEALSQLQARVERALVRAGLSPEARAFRPHITLVRLGRSAGSVDPFLTRTASLTGIEAKLDAFLLYESRLGKGGARYEVVARYSLR